MLKFEVNITTDKEEEYKALLAKKLEEQKLQAAERSGAIGAVIPLLYTGLVALLPNLDGIIGKFRSTFVGSAKTGDDVKSDSYTKKVESHAEKVNAAQPQEAQHSKAETMKDFEEFWKENGETIKDLISTYKRNR